MTASAELKSQVAWACRIMALHGHADITLGHVSARGPNETVLIKRKDIGLDEVDPSDVITVDMEGNKLEGEGQVHLETALHIEAYRLRPDAHAIAHTHPPYATALSATDASIELLNHDGLLFYEGIGSFDETAGLITSKKLGQTVAKALGQRKAVLMRNHGILVVGKSVPWLTYVTLTLERAAQIQFISSGFGLPKPLPKETAERLYADKYREEFVESYWRYLVRKVRRYSMDSNLPEDPK
ncbi:MAG: class II aldolase/adducin family protein [Chloroflexi bacterium]|nr:MAG: class II aldolase/adducin family protein [Chloroflexota bacterium]MBL1195054.1 class II aldolase/adducin family protein [Chloroflexota bacterium]NOH12342.1 class II aldolase/adducin family protein [Chloroflexota bacterium]